MLVERDTPQHDEKCKRGRDCQSNRVAENGQSCPDRFFPDAHRSYVCLRKVRSHRPGSLSGEPRISAAQDRPCRKDRRGAGD